MTIIFALLALGVAVFVLVFWLRDEHLGSEGLGYLVVIEVFFLGGALHTFWFLSHVDDYAVAVDASGIRFLAPQRMHLYVSWSSISGVRAHGFLQRLDLLSIGGIPPMRLEYQLEDFDRLLATLVREAPQLGTARSLPTAFGKRQVEVSEQEVRIPQRPARRIPLAEIDEIRLHLDLINKRYYALRMQVCLDSREVVTLPTGGSETFDLYRTLEQALTDTRNID